MVEKIDQKISELRAQIAVLESLKAADVPSGNIWTPERRAQQSKIAKARWARIKKAADLTRRR